MEALKKVTRQGQEDKGRENNGEGNGVIFAVPAGSRGTFHEVGRTMEGDGSGREAKKGRPGP